MPKVKGPKDGKIVTASFDPQDKKDNSKSRFPSLKTTNDLVLLSIKGNEYCAGEYLEAIVQQVVAIHQTGFEYSGVKGKATFLIADEIYWHNLKGDSSLVNNEDAFDEVLLKRKALELGDSYFESNLGAFLTPLGITVDEFNKHYSCKTVDDKIEIINKLAMDKGKNFEIVRWHTWVTQDDFDQKLKEIVPLYTSVEGLKVAIDKSVKEFAQRHIKDGNDPDLWRERSTGYLTEESPSIMLLAAKLGYNFIIYPGSILPPFTATKEYFVVADHVARIVQGQNIKEECTHDKFCLHVENPSRLVNWLEVNFARKHENVVAKSEKVSDKSAVSFFSSKPQSKSIIHEQGHPKMLDTLTAKENEGAGLDLVLKNEMASSIFKGINLALEREFFPRKSAKNPPSALTQMFEGITQGVLATELPMSDKVAFMAELVNAYVSRLTPEPDYGYGALASSLAARHGRPKAEARSPR